MPTATATRAEVDPSDPYDRMVGFVAERINNRHPWRLWHVRAYLNPAYISIYINGSEIGQLRVHAAKFHEPGMVDVSEGKMVGLGDHGRQFFDEMSDLLVRREGAAPN